MNILLINWRCIKNPLAGGAEVHYHEIFKRIARRDGVNVTLLASKFSGAAVTEDTEGINVVRTGGAFDFNFFVPRAVKRLLKSQKYDIVVEDINKIPFYTPLYVKKPVLGIVHHLFKKSIFNETNFIFGSYVYFSEKLIGTVFKKVPFAVVSRGSKNDLIKEGIPEKNISLIYNAVDLEKYRPYSGDKNNVDTICYFGRMKRYKRVDHLLSAFKVISEKYPALKLRIIGDGDNINELKSFSASLGIDNKVEFTGFLPHEKIVKFVAGSLFTVNPSLKEGWGLTIIESNACGVPVIASDSPGLRESVVDGKTGFLYPHGDINELIKFMDLLISDSSLRVEMGKEALVWARKFSWDNSADEMYELMKQVIIDHNPA